MNGNEAVEVMAATLREDADGLAETLAAHARAVPRTQAGRRLFTDQYPMDMWESDGVLPEDIVAVENEAAAAERERMRSMRHDYQTLPHAEFPIKWPNWREYEEVLPTYCGCPDCHLWRSGS